MCFLDFPLERPQNYNLSVLSTKYSAIPYRASTGPEQGFPRALILTGKNLFSLQGTPFLIAGILYSLQGIPFDN